VTVLGAVEIGGTKTDLAVGTSPDDISKPHRVSTTTHEETVGAIAEFFRSHNVGAVGVASFGPLDLDRKSSSYGKMLATPKPGWSGFDLYRTLRGGIGVPVFLDTDVNGAALGEGRWGAATGMMDYAYVTVGTGIGAGVVVDGRVISGSGHPEMGHIAVRRLDGDDYPGRCPYHRNCLEGMAAGPALEERFGSPESWVGNDQVIDLVAHYLAQGLLALLYIAAPVRIIVGGGVSTLPGLHQRARHRLAELIAGYPEEPDLDLLVSRPGLGDLSGLLGGLVLATRRT
jgi:fructokinase